MILAETDTPRARILIVEDENLVALDIERGLKRLGYSIVGVVNNGLDALQKAEEEYPDLILMDIQIKGEIDGIETSERLHRNFNIPVVFLTAHADEATLQRAKLTGPFGYVLKPFEETELHTAIQVAMQKHRAMSEQQKYANMELQQSEEKFKILIESLRDYAICMLDLDGKVSSWNWGAQRTFGYKQEEIIGQNFSFFSCDDDTANGTPQWEIEQAKTAGSMHDEGWRKRKDGTKFWALVSLTRMNDAAGYHIGYAMVTRDLTERKCAEDRLRLANEGLEKRIQERTAKLIEALQIRDEFLSIASHELRNPLAAMCLQQTLLSRYFIDFLNEKNNFPSDFLAGNAKILDKIAKAIGSSQRQGKRLSSLVDQLLDLTSIRIGKLDLKKELFNIAEVVEEIIDQQKADVPDIPDIKFVKPKNIIIGNWDRSRLEQIIGNLISNAIKYGNGNPIEVAISSDPENNSVSICVKDQGIGISKEMQESIFDKFQRIPEVRNINGLGLGLYIVKKIVEAHGGNVYVQSIPKQGSSFIVELPVATPLEEPFTTNIVASNFAKH